MKELGIFGGTFSPPHLGHVAAAKAFLDALSLDELLIVPARIPPHKYHEPIRAKGGLSSLPDGELRCRMLELAFDLDENGRNGKISLCRYELENDGPSYTVNTLRHFASPDTRITLLCGTDMFLTLDTWHEAENIFRLARIAAADRTADRQFSAGMREKAEFYREKYGAQTVFLDFPPVIISSTGIRERIAAGEDVSGLLPDRLAAFLRENEIYTK